MHRTQLLLEDWQYDGLLKRAEREGRSVSALVRDIIGASLATPSPVMRAGLDAIAGIGEDAASYGEQHDKYLRTGMR